MRFPMTLAQVDLRLIGPHVAWPQAAAVVPTVAPRKPHETHRDAPGVTQRNFGTDGQRASKLPAVCLGGNE